MWLQIRSGTPQEITHFSAHIRQAKGSEFKMATKGNKENKGTSTSEYRAVQHHFGPLVKHLQHQLVEMANEFFSKKLISKSEHGDAVSSRQQPQHTASTILSSIMTKIEDDQKWYYVLIDVLKNSDLREIGNEIDSSKAVGEVQDYYSDILQPSEVATEASLLEENHITLLVVPELVDPRRTEKKSKEKAMKETTKMVSQLSEEVSKKDTVTENLIDDQIEKNEEIKRLRSEKQDMEIRIGELRAANAAKVEEVKEVKAEYQAKIAILTRKLVKSEEEMTKAILILEALKIELKDVNMKEQ